MILCNCVVPSVSKNNKLISGKENEKADQHSITGVSHAHFVSVSTVRCQDEAEVECSKGYVYFDPNVSLFQLKYV